MTDCATSQADRSMLFVLTVQEIGKIQPFGRICYITRMLTFISNTNFTNVMSDYPKSRKNLYFYEELYAPKLPNVQYACSNKFVRLL